MKKRLFGNHISPDCAYCQNGLKEQTGSFSCARGKTISPNGLCKAFLYDPLKRVPRTAPALPSHSPEEFVL